MEISDNRGATLHRGKIAVALTFTLRRQTPAAVGVIPAGLLKDRCRLAHRDPRTETGYQPTVSPARVNRLMNDLLARRVDLPTAVLLNARHFDPDVHLVAENGSLYLDFESERASSEPLTLHVIDGKHRIEALARLVELDPDRWSPFSIPFVCMLGAHEREEIEQFYIVNARARRVPTHLALETLREQAERDPAVTAIFAELRESWRAAAQAITKDLADTSVWRGLVQFSGDAKGVTTITSYGLDLSLKQLLAAPYFGSLATESQVKILDAYWQAIRSVVPDAFAEPTRYTMQKLTGVTIMHTFLIAVLETIRSMQHSVVEPLSYSDALEAALLQLEGYTSGGDVARGADFWRTGPEGAAGSYSSNAGRRVLLAKLKASLPEVEVE